MPGEATQRYNNLTRFRALFFSIAGVAYLACILRLSGSLEAFLQALYIWSTEFAAWILVVAERLFSALGVWLSEFWVWYRLMVETFPLQSLTITVQIVFGLPFLILFARRVPTWGQVRNAGVHLTGYFWIQTLFWIAISIQLPLSVYFTITGVNPLWHFAAFGTLVFFIAVIYAWLALREKFDPKKFRNFVEPIITALTPGIGALSKAHASQILPEGVSSVLRWIVVFYKGVILGGL